MSAMGEMPMPGGWTMSMAWMRMPVLRKEDGALIGRCGLTDLAVESAAAEHGIRRGWFGRAQPLASR
jgi:hypothetical protein